MPRFSARCARILQPRQCSWAVDLTGDGADVLLSPTLMVLVGTCTREGQCKFSHGEQQAGSAASSGAASSAAATDPGTGNATTGEQRTPAAVAPTSTITTHSTSDPVAKRQRPE